MDLSNFLTADARLYHIHMAADTSLCAPAAAFKTKESE